MERSRSTSKIWNLEEEKKEEETVVAESKSENKGGGGEVKKGEGVLG